MAQVIKELINFSLGLMRIEITTFDFTFTLWQLLIFGSIVGLLWNAFFKAME